MKIATRIGFVSLFLISPLFLQATAFAEMLEGRVVRANSQSLDLRVYDPQGRPYPNTLNLKVDAYTRVTGVSSVSNLRTDDAVSAQVYQDESRTWHVDRVTLFQEMNARPATQNPPPSLRDVLGNPMVRGALLGAATGAIASSTSGGKAGKGALVGAGVGAAAGLLGQMFSQNSKSSQNSDDQR